MTRNKNTFGRLMTKVAAAVVCAGFVMFAHEAFGARPDGVFAAADAPAAAAAAGATESEFTTGIVLLFVGMIVVFITLMLIQYMIRALVFLENRFFPPSARSGIRLEEEDLAELGDAYIETESGAESSNAITPVTLAVLTAAATAAVGKSVQIRSVKMFRGQDQSAWVTQGRVDIQGSHAMAKRSG